MKNKRAQSRSEGVRTAQDKTNKKRFAVVGIGTAARGIPTFEEFFSHITPDSGIAYVALLDSFTAHPHAIKDVLERCSTLPVIEVTDKSIMVPDHIYLVPADKPYTLEGNWIASDPKGQRKEQLTAWDVFFDSMAEELGPRAIAIILSGMHSKASIGLKRVRENGGACFVQHPLHTGFSVMPPKAGASKPEEDLLSVAEIPGKIKAYQDCINMAGASEFSNILTDDQQQALRDILNELRIRTGHDFSSYKRPSLFRRMQRRVSRAGLSGLSAYARYLRDTPSEPAALLKELLISVTNFFRDKKPFDLLEQEVLPALFKAKTNRDQIRIWVAGCATGEEAYSIAMLCAEHTLGIIDAPKVQIFATDIDEHALVRAREGLYSLDDTAGVSPERLLRFFSKEGEMYRIRREIRETILFATHNFLKDPAFADLDMVSCRNVLIYLNKAAQERAVETFHFALKPSAYLFLGTSESTEASNALYSVYNRENHIFQRRHSNLHSYPIPEWNPTPHFEKFKTTASSLQHEKQRSERRHFSDLHQHLLEGYAPPSLVVNELFDIVHLSDNAGQYLQLSAGEPSTNLLKLIKKELGPELVTALYQSSQSGSAVEARGVKVTTDNKTQTINMKVRPALRSDGAAKGYILIIFETVAAESVQEMVLCSAAPWDQQRAEERARVKIQLRTANEYYDLHVEEMKATNEELHAMNEELRSAAEELATHKEELQSANEELCTLNEELQIKIEQTRIASNNLQNIINSTDIGTIFLDRSFRVVFFTPAATKIFNLIPADQARLLSDITHKLEYHNLQNDAENILEKLHVIEKEVRTRDAESYLMRLKPYRTDDDRIDGVVLTFIHIAANTKAQEKIKTLEEKYRRLHEMQAQEGVTALQETRDQYLTLAEHTTDAISRWDKELNLLFANSVLENQTGIKIRTLIGKRYPEMKQDIEVVIPYGESLHQAFTTGRTVKHQSTVRTRNGLLYFDTRIIPEINPRGTTDTVIAITRISPVSEYEQ